jgi:hypothetical protein
MDERTKFIGEVFEGESFMSSRSRGDEKTASNSSGADIWTRRICKFGIAATLLLSLPIIGYGIYGVSLREKPGNEVQHYTALRPITGGRLMSQVC